MNYFSNGHCKASLFGLSMFFLEMSWLCPLGFKKMFHRKTVCFLLKLVVDRLVCWSYNPGALMRLIGFIECFLNWAAILLPGLSGEIDCCCWFRVMILTFMPLVWGSVLWQCEEEERETWTARSLRIDRKIDHTRLRWVYVSIREHQITFALRSA